MKQGTARDRVQSAERFRDRNVAAPLLASVPWCDLSIYQTTKGKETGGMPAPRVSPLPTLAKKPRWKVSANKFTQMARGARNVRSAPIAITICRGVLPVCSLHSAGWDGPGLLPSAGSSCRGWEVIRSPGRGRLGRDRHRARGAARITERAVLEPRNVRRVRHTALYARRQASSSKTVFWLRTASHS